MRLRLLTALLFLVANGAIAAEFHRYLLPIATNVVQPGANGALWRERFVLANDSGTTLRLRGGDVIPGLVCLGIATCADTIAPGQTMQIHFPFYSRPHPPGLLYYVRADVIPSMSLRVYNSLQDQHGTPVPIVSEDEFFTGAINLLDVQLTNAERRTLLRIYDPDAVAGRSVRVRAYSASGMLVADQVVFLEVPQQPADLPHPIYPGYAALALHTGLSFVENLNPNLPLRVKIEPMTPGQRIWAMVSMTSNANNAVTLVVPEP